MEQVVQFPLRGKLAEWIDQGISITINISPQAGTHYVRVNVPEEFQHKVIELINHQLQQQEARPS